MGFDLVWFFRNFDPGSPHHIAAVHELAAIIPGDQLTAQSEWVNTFLSADMELKYDSSDDD